MLWEVVIPKDLQGLPHFVQVIGLGYDEWREQSDKTTKGLGLQEKFIKYIELVETLSVLHLV